MPRGWLRASPWVISSSPPLGGGEVLFLATSTRLVLAAEIPGRAGLAGDDGALIVVCVPVAMETSDHVITKWRTVSRVLSYLSLFAVRMSVLFTNYSSQTTLSATTAATAAVISRSASSVPCAPTWTCVSRYTFCVCTNQPCRGACTTLFVLVFSRVLPYPSVVP